MDGASRTAEFMALFRALESCRRPAEARLFEDRFARGFLRPSLRSVVRLARLPLVGRLVPWLIDRRWPGARTSAVARTRLIDDVLAAALREGVHQVIILGAGFDCRAYRIPGIERTRVFEIDHPATLAAKRQRLVEMLGALPEHVTLVAVDFNRERLGEVMEASGIEPAARAIVIWEGVTNYLTEAAVDATLRYVSTSMAPSSLILFTYVHRGVLDGSVAFGGTRSLQATLRRVGEPWTFGIHPAELPAYLAERGLALIEDLGASDYRARYWGQSGRHLTGYEFYRVAMARVGGAGIASGGARHGNFHGAAS